MGVGFDIFFVGCSSVMIARGALWNCSIFQKNGEDPREKVVRKYLEHVCNKFGFDSFSLSLSLSLSLLTLSLSLSFSLLNCLSLS